jgi:hypothetical protein
VELSALMLISYFGSRGESPTWLLIAGSAVMVLLLIRYLRNGVAWFRQLYDNDPKPGHSKGSNESDGGK